ncbi:transcriptional regulator, TetR family [Mycolicibacterium canariasense]|uniref:Transcriptional regulator, TetR family n=1 Tax=Mycolicibacterium canariasense TaxID=228230 RepID=A0A100W7R1_MYCCR|nr:TetR/AcrR family transcriptional regulator [Mycolicibacterium canariasense]MCV7212347.1 TetR/AcrR family transcriptional regulator [Mycolicibacterium canariasense]ORV17954.1 TetR family transcriptional regulator [Mycolicibacterium canariasense]GAS93254.1 transcriptional regulator, TetR family [Mycolicibacterium canariasense]
MSTTRRPGRSALPATERGRRSRAAIVDAAAAAIYANGVAATSLDDVLTSAGCGKSQLYHYFSGKAELVRAVIERQLELVLDCQPEIHRVDSWAGLRRWVDQIVDMHRAPGGPFACPLGSLAAELKGDETYAESLALAFGRWESLLAAGLRKMRDRGQLPPGADPESLSRSILATLQGSMLLARVHGDVTIVSDAMDKALATMQPRKGR